MSVAAFLSRLESAKSSRLYAGLISIVMYVAFAAFIYAVHGPEPSLSVDHISYFRLADEIRTEWPGRDYWRTFNSVRAYGVILAYLFDYTGAHLISLKLLLAGITVAYLVAFQVFMGLATRNRWEAVLFSLISALFVSFGASIWGMTDFAASLNRSLVVPFIVLLVWFFFRFFHSPWRYAVFPLLVVVSLLHLSALHVILVFAAFEALDFLFRRRCRIDRDIGYLIVSLIASGGIQFAMESTGAGTAGYIRYTLNVALPKVPTPAAPEEKTPPPVEAEVPTAAAPPGGAPAAAAPPEGAPAATQPPGPAVPPLPKIRKPPLRLTPEEAWKIELYAFPWRNLPPTFATLVTIATSYGVIFLLAVGGAYIAFRRRTPSPLDRLMLVFAGAVLLASYGLQSLLWLVRNVTSIFPINFEEIRAINMLMFPSMYFIYRLYESAPPVRRFSPRAVRIAIIAAFILQPILLVRMLPQSWREGIVDVAVEQGWIRSGDALRVIYARQFLGLSEEGRRFYYSARPAMTWLERNARPGQKILTNVNEFCATPLKTVGAFLGVMSMDVWDPRREVWADEVGAVDRVLATGDTQQVLTLARAYQVDYAVVTWPVAGAVYSDKYYSILKVK